MQKNQSNLRTALWILGVLLFLAVIAAVYFWKKTIDYEEQTIQLNEDIENLDDRKAGLEDTIEILESDYDTKITENEALSQRLQIRVKEVSDLQNRIKRVQAQLAKSEKTNEEITQRLEQLDTLKNSLEEDIATLLSENDELRALNNEIATELTETKEEVMGLSSDVQILNTKNDALVSRLSQIAPAGFVAENFKVTAVKRNDKVTARAGRAREIKVNFDIDDVPAEYQREEELYLVITTFDGNPVDEIFTRNVKIDSPTPINVAAADVQQITLQARQSVEMSFAPDRKFKGGLYNVLVYADHGFLGASSFELQ